MVVIGLTLAFGWEATFDDLEEGWWASEITEDGIRLHDLDPRMPDGNPTVTIEDASETLAGVAGFTSPNILGFGGYSGGPGAAFGRFGAISITPPEPATDVTFTVFDGGFEAGQSLTLQAFLDGAGVGEVVVPLGQAGFGGAIPVALQGVWFDDLRLVASSVDAAFIGLDTVVITVDPALAETDAPTDALTDPSDVGTDGATDEDLVEATDEDRVDAVDDDAATDAATDELESTDKAAACGCATPAGGAPWWLVALAAFGRRRR